MQRLANEETDHLGHRDRGVFESTTDGLVISDWDGNVVEVNPAFCTMHGYALQDRCVAHPRDFVHAGSHSVYEELIATVHAGRPFEGLAAHIRKDGTGFPVEVHATAFTYLGAPHI